MSRFKVSVQRWILLDLNLLLKLASHSSVWLLIRIVTVNDTEEDMIIFFLLIFFSLLYLSLTEVENLSISTLEKVLFLYTRFECTVKRQDGIWNEAKVAVESLTHIRIFPVRYQAPIFRGVLAILDRLVWNYFSFSFLSIINKHRRIGRLLLLLWITEFSIGIVDTTIFPALRLYKEELLFMTRYWDALFVISRHIEREILPSLKVVLFNFSDMISE